MERRIEDLLLRGRYKAGDRIPPEAELVESLGVSRVTVRAGLARLVDRGILERRQGSGTFLVRLPDGDRLRSGLEKLESYTVHAERLGVVLSSLPWFPASGGPLQINGHGLALWLTTLRP